MTPLRVLITTIPAQDASRPPGILSILAACCESINSEYVIQDLNLYMYKTLPDHVTTELVNDFLSNNFRSDENKKWYDQICEYYVTQIRKHRPTHIAISIFTFASILAGDYLLNYIKNAKIEYEFKIIIGGLGISDIVANVTGGRPFGEYCLDNKLIDYCVYGEGDFAFTELLKGNTTYPGINRPNQSQLLDLDIIPIPSYKQISPADYFHAGDPEVLMTGSRGCVRNCSFCDVGHYWEKYVYKSGKRLATELFNTWQATGVQKFDFSDSLINGSIKTFRQFNQEIIRLRSLHHTFAPLYKGQFICRPQGQLKEKDYEEMALAGAETLVVGIESFSQSVRDHMRKKFSNQDIDWHFAMSAKYGIKNVLLLLAGYVTETLTDHKTTIEYLKKYQIYALSRTIYAINITVNGLVILKGAPLYNEVSHLGLVFDNNEFDNNETHADSWTSLSNPDLTPKERLRRSVELVHTAYSLGYKVLHFDMKLDSAEGKFSKLNKVKKKFEIQQV